MSHSFLLSLPHFHDFLEEVIPRCNKQSLPNILIDVIRTLATKLYHGYIEKKKKMLKTTDNIHSDRPMIRPMNKKRTIYLRLMRLIFCLIGDENRKSTYKHTSSLA